MNTTELREEIKRCHPDNLGGSHARVGRFQELVAALKRRCRVCNNPMPFKRSPSKMAKAKFCGKLCELRVRSRTIAGALAGLLLAIPAFGETVKVQWDASPSLDVTSYTITLKQGTNAPQRINLAGLTTSLTLSNSTEIYVQAVASSGLVSDPSNMVIWHPTVTNAPPTKPLPPGAVRVTTVTTTTIIETNQQ